MLAVCSAGIRVTWVGLLNNWNSSGDKGALCDCITGVTIEAGADGHVTHRIANSIDTTHSGAGIDTLVVDTGSLAGAVSVENTLRSAGKVRVAEVASNAGTGTGPLAGSTLRIGSAGSWIAGVDNFNCSHSSCGDHNPSAVSEWVASVPGWTSAYGLVVLHHTLCIWSTRARAWVNTFFIETCLVAGTFCIDGAFWSAVGWHSDVVWLTSASSNLIALSAGGEGAARGGAAGVDRNRSWWRSSDDHLGTLTERITSKTRGALTHRVMVGDLTSCIVSTNTRAGINTFLVDARCEMVTIRADHTLGSTGRWGALVGGQARADAHSIDFTMLAVWTTGIGITWISVHHNRCWRNQCTSRYWVSFISTVAGADRIVISDRTLGIAATRSRAGIGTLFLHAGKVVRAFRVDETLRTAANIWVTKVVGDAATGASPVS